MTKKISVWLGQEYQDFLRTQMECGRFGSASEAIRAGLRLLEGRERLRSDIDRDDASREPSCDPFATFREWMTEADEKAFADL